MTTTTDYSTAAGSDLVTAQIAQEQDRPARSKTLTRGAIVIAVIIVIAIALPAIATYVKKADLITGLEHRLEILAQGRAEVADIWLESMMRPASRVVDSELFRLFATEMDISGGDISGMTAGKGQAEAGASTGLGVPLAAQLPFMQQVLTDFTKNADFLAGYVINRDGTAYVTSAGADTISTEQQALAKQVFEANALRYGLVRTSPAGLVMDVYAPVFRAQSETGRDETVGVLLLVTPVGKMLSEILTEPPLAEPGERLRLVQLNVGAFQEIVPGGAPPLRPAENLKLATPAHNVPFSKRQTGSGDVYSVGAAVNGPSWWVVQQIDAVAAEAKLSGFITAAIIVALLAVITVITAFGAFWWRLSNEHSSALAEQFRRLAARIEAQKKLLDSINNSITDYIGLKSPEGVYRYVNPAFARAIGREVSDAIGLDDHAIFGKGTADRLKQSDQRALASNAAVTVNEEVYLDSKLHYMQISKVPYQDETGETAGIVSVTRDVTDLIEEQKKKERAVEQMVSALVRAVELRDPYLAGHSRRLAGFAVAVAQRLDASAEEIATVEIAANLSQIGKLAVSRELLNKPERLNEAEIIEIQQHVNHAATILRDIDFELPVFETIYQMHERLDGGGYPEGLSGNKIRLTAQILGACDVLCARVEPRSYRAGISADVALGFLDQNDGRYDPKIIAALRQVVESVAGEKLIAGLAS